MNNQDKYQEDLLRQYINSDGIEKPDEEFTSKVMSRIHLETVPVAAVSGSGNRNLVPVISTVVTILLIVAALLIPDSKSDALTLQAINLLNNIKSALPGLKLSSIFSISLPSVLMYIFIGILLLTFFDRVLYGIFHREKQ
jgi:hypothetical protein